MYFATNTNYTEDEDFHYYGLLNLRYEIWLHQASDFLVGFLSHSDIQIFFLASLVYRYILLRWTPLAQFNHHLRVPLYVTYSVKRKSIESIVVKKNTNLPRPFHIAFLGYHLRHVQNLFRRGLGWKEVPLPQPCSSTLLRFYWRHIQNFFRCRLGLREIPMTQSPSTSHSYNCRHIQNSLRRRLGLKRIHVPSTPASGGEIRVPKSQRRFRPLRVRNSEGMVEPTKSSITAREIRRPKSGPASRSSRF
jgi:hypothetical protein